MLGRTRDRASRHTVDTLSGMHLFSACRRHEIEHLARLFEPVERPAGTVIVREGEPGTEFFIIVEGTASASVGDHAVTTLGAGDFFGEMALLDHSPRSATVTATTDVELLVADSVIFSRMVASTPSVGVRMMRTLSGRLRAAEVTPAVR